MSKLCPADITVTDVDHILQSSEDAIATFTAQTSLVKRLRKQNQDRSWCSSRSPIWSHHTLNQKVVHLCYKWSHAEASKRSFSKLRSNCCRWDLPRWRKMLQMRGSQNWMWSSNWSAKSKFFWIGRTNLPPTPPLRSVQSNKIPCTVTKDCGPYHPTFNPPEAANLVFNLQAVITYYESCLRLSCF